MAIIARRAATTDEQQRYGSGPNVDIQIGTSNKDGSWNEDIAGYQKAGYQILNNDYVDPSTTHPAPRVPQSDIPSVVSDLNITGGSDGLRAAETGVQTDAQNFLSDIDKANKTSQEDLGKRLAELDKLAADAKTLSETDLSTINSEVARVGSTFDAPIAQARESARQTLATQTVDAGEKGGFMNTQYSGQAALTPTNGNDFIGAGGKLAEVKGQLDSNIASLEMAKNNAMEEARKAATEAIRTKKSSDLKIAQDIYDRAVNAAQAQQSAIEKRYQIVTQMKSEQSTLQDRAYTRIKDLGSFGFDSNSFSPIEKRQLEASAGLPLGTVDAIIDAGFDAKNVKTASDQAATADKIITVLKNIPAGRVIKIGDSSYEGLKSSNPETQIFSETDSRGNVTYVTVDKNTGKILSSASGGLIGKGKDASSTSQLDYAGTLNKLKSSKGSDGFVNTQTYADLLDEYRSKGEASKFTANFPPEDFLNPKDPTALKFFETSTQAQKGSGRTL